VQIKIDTEGAELSVLQGAQNVMRKVSPTIIFESNSGADRPAILGLLTERGYDLFALPYTGERAEGLSGQSFLASPATNFIAVAAD
jgi:methyltransferase FkbM-like protein